MTNGSVLSVGPQDILVGDRDYVSGKWSHLAALTFLPWAAPGSSATSSRTYGWLGLLPHTLHVQSIPKADNKMAWRGRPQSMTEFSSGSVL